MSLGEKKVFVDFARVWLQRIVVQCLHQIPFGGAERTCAENSVDRLKLSFRKKLFASWLYLYQLHRQQSRLFGKILTIESQHLFQFDQNKILIAL